LERVAVAAEGAEAEAEGAVAAAAVVMMDAARGPER